MAARYAPLCAVLAGCATPIGSAALADDGAPRTVLDLLAEQVYWVPDDAPDELVLVPDAYHAGRTISLRDADVIGAWSTVPSPSGDPPALELRCAPGSGRWLASPDAWLAPLGFDPSAYPDLAPFAARVGPQGFTLDASVSYGSAPPVPVRSAFVGALDASFPSGNGDTDARLRKVSGYRLGPPAQGSFDHADYVLRMHTAVGAGPDEGSRCSPGEPAQRVELDADFTFVRVADAGDP